MPSVTVIWVKKTLKITLLVTLIPIILHCCFGHSANFETCKQYRWFFKDYIQKDVDPYPLVCSSWVKERDVFNDFSYYYDHKRFMSYSFDKALSNKCGNLYSGLEEKFDKKKFIAFSNCAREVPLFLGHQLSISIWEFKDLSDIDLDKIAINQGVNLEGKHFWFGGEVLDAHRDKDNNATGISVRYGFRLKHAMNVNLDNYSKVEKSFEGKNYKGFYGTVNRMSFSNGIGMNQIIFNYGSIINELFLLYKGHGSFYVIIINSEKPFKDESIINILNLD